MTGYILSVLGIIIAGVLIDVIIPNGTICKYVKSIYSIFVVAVLINPIFNLVSKTKDFTFKYDDFKADQKLLEYSKKVKSNIGRRPPMLDFFINELIQCFKNPEFAPDFLKPRYILVGETPKWRLKAVEK